MIAAARTYTGRATPKGCLLATATASGSAASADVQEAVPKVRRAIDAALQRRIARDVADGALPPATDAGALAGLVMAVNQGMSVLARDGATRAHLLSIADAAQVGEAGSVPALACRARVFTGCCPGPVAEMRLPCFADPLPLRISTE